MEAAEEGEPATGLAAGCRGGRGRDVRQKEGAEERREDEEAERDLEGVDQAERVGDNAPTCDEMPSQGQPAWAARVIA